MQYAIADFMLEKDHYLNLGKFLQNKRDYFANLMKQTPFEPLPSFGSYFQLYSYKNISDESESDFAIKLTQDAGVASIPVSAFYKTPIDNKVLRFCFAKKEATLDAAVERLVTYFNK
jgi:methionine aminotransferase